MRHKIRICSDGKGVAFGGSVVVPCGDVTLDRSAVLSPLVADGWPFQLQLQLQLPMIFNYL